MHSCRGDVDEAQFSGNSCNGFGCRADCCIQNGLSTMNESHHIHNICWVASWIRCCISWICGFISKRNILQTPDSSSVLIELVHHVFDAQSDLGIRQWDSSLMFKFGAVRSKRGRSRHGQPKFNKPSSRLNSTLRHGSNNSKTTQYVLPVLRL